MTDEKTIMFDSVEAATHRTDLTGWVDRHGHYYGSDERAARYSGCTHRKCESCEEIIEKNRIRCDLCQKTLDLKNYEALEHKDWDGKTPLYSYELDRYIFDGDELDIVLEELIEKGPKDLMSPMLVLRLVICEPQKLKEIPEDYFMDELPEEGDLPDDVAKALDELNEAIEDAGTVSWTPGNYRTTVV